MKAKKFGAEGVAVQGALLVEKREDEWNTYYFVMYENTLLSAYEDATLRRKVQKEDIDISGVTDPYNITELSEKKPQWKLRLSDHFWT